MAIRAGRVGPRLLGQVLLPSPTSRTSCCPRRAPGWQSRGHRGRRAETRSEGCRSVQWGRCATRCALGGGCSPQVPQGSRQSKLTFLQHPKPEPVFLKLFAPCSPEEFKDSSAAERLHLCPFALGPAQSRSTRTRSCAQPVPAALPGCLAALSDFPAGEPGTRRALAPAPTGQFSGTGWSQTRRCSGSRQPPTSWECLFPLVSSRQQDVSQHFGTHKPTWPQPSPHNHLAKSQGHPRSQNPSWGWTGVF